jgi:hypothetical protein
MPVDDKGALYLKSAIGNGGMWNIHSCGIDTRSNEFQIIQDDPYIFGGRLNSPG